MQYKYNMTTTIQINVAGDHWFNKLKFVQSLEATDPTQTLVLDVNSEAPCLKSLGVRAVLDAWLHKHNKSPETVVITKWRNTAELVPYQRLSSTTSQFFKYSKNYWPDSHPLESADAKLFGLFLGRRTIARNVILYLVANNYSDHFLLSLMKNKNPNKWPSTNEDTVNLEVLDQWATPIEQLEIKDWIETSAISSLDGLSQQDQYTVVEQSAAECNRSLLCHYHKFHIEIVCETYTIGDTFFPTEKTVRPISSAKPMLVYGPRYFLQRLQELGFKTYSTCWNEDYDTLQGPERWQAIQMIIDNLIRLSKSEVCDLLADAKQIAVNNRAHLEKMISS